MKYIRFAFLLLWGTQLFAQQEPQFTMYTNIYSLQNPAATGLFCKHYASLIGRKQWAGFPGAPQSFGAVYNYRAAKLHSGIGVNYLYDKLGLVTDNKFNLSYSYQVALKNEAVLGLGIGFSLDFRTIDFTKFKPISNDPSLNIPKQSDYVYDLNLGVMYKSERLLLGLGATQYTKAYSSNLLYTNQPHLFLTSSYNIPVSTNITIRPGVYIKTDLNSCQYDFNVITSYKQRCWIGASYRLTDAVSLMAGFDIKGKYRIGYAHDFTTSYIYNDSHELVLAMMLD